MKTQNTFSEGLNMDANALVAPSNVMSNCLNGTLITYNGNEGVLQNDMGNAKVHKAYLPAGWVPVGMAEYGGIIYVASYNPELRQSQLGSFPSPQQSFENSINGEEILFKKLKPGKYKLFTGNNKDMELKPGNKIAISLGYLENNNPVAISYLDIELNYNKQLQHKRRWTVLLCLLTSSGLLTDITNNVKTLVNEKEALSYNEGYKNYFFLQSYVPKSLDNYLRVYDGNLIGSPYIQVIENLASSMDTFVTTSYQDSKVKFTVTCNFNSSSLLYGYKHNDEVEQGLIGFYYTYTSTKGLSGEGYKEITKYANGKVLMSCKSKEEADNKIEQLINCGISLDNLIVSEDLYIYQLANYSLVETTPLEYTLNITDTIEIPNVNKNDNITLIINPCFKWNNEVNLQKSLEFKQTFDVDKIGSGIHRINQWRYYYNSDFITLTWGMESYPAEGESIKSLQMEFLDYNGTPINFGDTTLEFKYFSYNGEFTYLLESSLFEKYPYIVKIHWIVGGRTMSEDRWIIPTPLYNTFYQYKLVQDFYLDWDKTEYGKEMAKLTTIEEVPFNIVGDPQEYATIGDWPTFNTVYLDKSNILLNTITKVNTYEYQLPIPQVIPANNADVYPFNVKLSNPSKFDITVNLDNAGETVIDNQKITHTLSTTHHLQYIENDNIKVNKIFETYYDLQANTLNGADSYISIIANREHHGSGGSDDNWSLLNVCGNIINSYNNPKSNVSQGVHMEQIILKYDHADGDRGLSLVNDPEKGDSWDNIVVGKLNELSRDYKNSRVIIPVMFICKSYGYSLLQLNSTIAHRWAFNWAVHTEDGWALYWNSPKKWTYTNQNNNGNIRLYDGGLPEEHISDTGTPMHYQIINRRFSLNEIPPTIYEARGNYNLLRCVKDETFNNTIKGYLAANDFNYPSTQDQESLFKFNTSLTVNTKILALFDNTLDYNSSIDTFYIPLVKLDLRKAFALLLKFTYNGQYITENGIDLIINKEYEFTNTISGTQDIVLNINNLLLVGIDSLVCYSPNNDGNIVYVIPSEELNADVVYKLELDYNKTIVNYVEVPSLGVKKLSDEIRHIVPRNLGKHISLVISCDSSGRAYTDLTGVPTANIENLA